MPTINIGIPIDSAASGQNPERSVPEFRRFAPRRGRRNGSLIELL